MEDSQEKTFLVSAGFKHALGRNPRFMWIITRNSYSQFDWIVGQKKDALENKQPAIEILQTARRG